MNQNNWYCPDDFYDDELDESEVIVTSLADDQTLFEAENENASIDQGLFETENANASGTEAFLKPNSKIRFIVGLDTEYADHISISMQCHVKCLVNEKVEYEFSFIVFNSFFREFINQQLSEGKIDYFSQGIVPQGIDFYVYFADLDSTTSYSVLYNTILNILFFKKDFPQESFPTENVSLDLYFYYSLRDITIALGQTTVLPVYQGKKNKKKNTLVKKKGSITQKRSIFGNIPGEASINEKLYSVNFILHDLFGWNSDGLKSLIKATGLIEFLDDKDSLDQYKACMDVALRLYPNTFVKYSMNDCLCLIPIVEAQVRSMNVILTDLGVKDKYHFTFEKIPLTVGRLVSELWLRYFQCIVLKDSNSIQLALKKFGILNKEASNYNENLASFEKLTKIKSLEELKNLEQSDEFENIFKNLTRNSAFLHTITEYCSIKFLVGYSDSGNQYLSAMTSGGRCNNEQPWDCHILNGADFDFLGAYGNQLKKLTLPIGKPRIYCKSPNELQNLTLGAFMDKYLSKMKKYKNFKVVVSGKLSFAQDLIYSKVPSTLAVTNKINTYSTLEVGQQTIANHFLLLRREIINGSITYENWEVLNKVCSNKELKDFRNLVVESALYYFDEDAVENIEDFADHILKDEGKFGFDNKSQNFIDSRSLKWCPVKIFDFINPLVIKRTALKRMKDPISQALNWAIKLIINSFWGDLTSVFFPLNNVILSEIVTNNVRTNLWLASKALNSHYSVTDGGAYSLEKVSFIKNKSEKCPSLGTFSDFRNYKEHRNIKIGSLGGINWDELFKQNLSPFEGEFNNIDALAKQHIYDFWQHYGLNLDFDIEHKKERTFTQCAYWSKSHYAMETYDNDTKKEDS